MHPFRRAALVLVLGVLALTAGCAQQERSSSGARPDGRVTRPLLEARPSGAAEFPAYAATATGSQVEVRDRPGGASVSKLASPIPSGAPLTFLVVEQQGDWLQVLLPVRPNGSVGWVSAADVVVEGVPYRLDVRTAAHEVDLYDRDRLVRTYPIGIGTRDTPTPGGTFYLKELLQPPNPAGQYGPYAFGLSGFSTTLDTFAGGEAVIGLHGTNDPTSIGKDVSFGCIRLRNDDITELAQVLPLGTPVRVLA